MSHLVHLVHLARRFATSLRPGGPPLADEAWATSCLLAGEARLWNAMVGQDRRHAVGVALRAAASLGPAASRPVLAAALLHDVGKVEAGLGTLARVVATVVAASGGRRRAPGWACSSGARARVGRYLLHDRIGARLLAGAGSDALTVAWAAEHHRPPSGWSVEPAVGAALKAADDD